MGEILQEVRAYEPDWYVATGPYRLDRYTENEMILVKNEDYYLDNSQSFDRIHIYQMPSNTNQIYSMLANGNIDYHDGAPLPEVIDNIIQSNPHMVHYKMIDQNSCGFYFNLEKELWDDDKVRLAFQYIFDREMIKNSSHPYAETSWYPMITMTQSQAEYWMNPDDFAKVKYYSHDPDNASELLLEAGWKKSANSWYDSQGNKVEITIGVENNTMFVNMAQAVQNELNRFGIATTIKIGESWNTWFSTGRQTDSIYDAFCGVVDANSFTTHPQGFMKHFFDILEAHMLHLPVNTITGRWDVVLNRVDGKGTVNLVDEIDKLFLVSDDALRVAVGNIVYGFGELNYGVQFYESMTGAFFNAGMVGGLPGLEELVAESRGRNIAYIPKVGDRYFNSIADLNVYYTQGSIYGLGHLYPRK
jgi:peptide/nickel transport system substrate-binding protein